MKEKAAYLKGLIDGLGIDENTKEGKVIKAMPKENRVIVEGVNIQTKHAKQTRTSPAEIKHQEGPIDVSNVMYYDSKAKAPTRIGYVIEDGKKYRISKKTGEKID